MNLRYNFNKSCFKSKSQFFSYFSYMFFKNLLCFIILGVSASSRFYKFLNFSAIVKFLSLRGATTTIFLPDFLKKLFCSFLPLVSLIVLGLAPVTLGVKEFAYYVTPRFKTVLKVDYVVKPPSPEIFTFLVLLKAYVAGLSRLLPFFITLYKSLEFLDRL